MNNDFDDYANTKIYRGSDDVVNPIGYVDNAGIIYKLRWDEGIRIGRVSSDRRVFRDTRYDEREVGSFSDDGRIHSHGLFEGGEIGWVEANGVVVQSGLILGEEDIGRVEGTAKVAAAAALLLIFYPEEQEAANRANR